MNAYLHIHKCNRRIILSINNCIFGPPRKPKNQKIKKQGWSAHTQQAKNKKQTKLKINKKLYEN
jgi:hypothetical protein